MMQPVLTEEVPHQQLMNLDFGTLKVTTTFL